MHDFDGKIAVITGATSGIGRASALALAGLGFRVVLVARDSRRADAMVSALAEVHPDAGHVAVVADLSQLGEMRRAAAEVRAAAPRIDVLVNNAGAIFPKRRITHDGLEMTFALNHLAYFVLTRLLLESLANAQGARVICTASRAHRGMSIDFGDLQSSRRYLGYGLLGNNAYGMSKLCNVLFTNQLAKRVKHMGITANCFHPGIVDSSFGAAATGIYGLALAFAKRWSGATAAEGARTLVYLATSPDVQELTGRYFESGAPRVPSSQARDEMMSERLWVESSRLAGLNVASP